MSPRAVPYPLAGPSPLQAPEGAAAHADCGVSVASSLAATSICTPSFMAPIRTFWLATPTRYCFSATWRSAAALLLASMRWKD